MILGIDLGELFNILTQYDLRSCDSIRFSCLDSRREGELDQEGNTAMQDRDNKKWESHLIRATQHKKESSRSHQRAQGLDKDTNLGLPRAKVLHDSARESGVML